MGISKISSIFYIPVSAKSPVAAVKVHNAEAVHLKKLSDAYEPNAFVNRIDVSVFLFIL